MIAKQRLDKLLAQPENIQFSDVMALISDCYHYTPTRFCNGEIVNEAGSNEGSCRLFYFAQLHALSETETLALFGQFYRDDVLENPAGEDHGNIRNFILDGWLGIKFDGVALQQKNI